MADLAQRIHKDMLVMSATVAPRLAEQGLDVSQGLQTTYIVEPESIQDAQRLELAAGAQILVMETGGFTPARLAHFNLSDVLGKLAKTAVESAAELKPQHIVVDLLPTGLPLDPSMKSSLIEHRDQFSRAVAAFEPLAPDAFLLDGFTDATELKCALMGAAKQTGRPLMATVAVNDEGVMPDGTTVEEAAALIEEMGGSVAGFVTTAKTEKAVAIAKRMSDSTACALAVQLNVVRMDKRQWEPTDENPYPTPASIFNTGLALREVGVQFLRVGGAATPAYTGALAAEVSGLDVLGIEIVGDEE